MTPLLTDLIAAILKSKDALLKVPQSADNLKLFGLIEELRGWHVYDDDTYYTPQGDEDPPLPPKKGWE